MSQTTINQRFTLFLAAKKISQKIFADVTGFSSATVSNIASGTTEYPKADFFQAMVRHYPEVNLRWLLTGDGEMYLPEGEGIERMVAREPDGPAYGSHDAEVERLRELVDKLADSLKSVANMVNAVPALQEEIERLKKRLAELEKK